MRYTYGYHYTSLENWKKIKKEGVKRYRLKGFTNKKGIFFWKSRLKGKSHAGTILWQMYSKNAENIVMLKIKLKKENILWGYSINHNGSIGNISYHKEEIKVYCKDIPKEDIELVKIYKLKNAFK